MTKRFIFEKNTGLKNDEVFVVIDNNTDEVFSLENERESNSLVIRMNELADENEQLEKSIEQLRTIIDDNIDFNSLFTNRELSDICNETGWELSEKSIKLQQLEKENEQLKSDRVRFEEETRLEITRRLDKVFDCIDKKINNLQRKYDFGQQEAGACPMHNLKHSINTLKELKKELEE